jgi:hypothetical protein
MSANDTERARVELRERAGAVVAENRDRTRPIRREHVDVAVVVEIDGRRTLTGERRKERPALDRRERAVAVVAINLVTLARSIVVAHVAVDAEDI